ncbi:hypothetical protein ACJ41O_006245 [Fusarium nematophilum]
MGLFNPLLRALSMMSRSLSLRHRLGRCMRLETLQDQADDASPTSLENEEQEEEQAIIQECFEMLDSFDTWDKEAAAYWQITFEGRAVPTALGEVFSDKTYYDAETACIIILVRSARLILLLTMLLYHSKLRVAHDEEQMTLDCNDLWVECISVLKRDVGKTIDDILSSVPYALGDVDPSGAPASMPHDGAGAIIIVHSIRLDLRKYQTVFVFLFRNSYRLAQRHFSLPCRLDISKLFKTMSSRSQSSITAGKIGPPTNAQRNGFSNNDH